MAADSLVLNGLSLNDVTNYTLLEVDFPPPRKRQEWVEGADADGAALVRDPLFSNREITMKLRVAPQANMNNALSKIGSVVDQIEESENNPNGTALVWTPAGASSSVTFYVLSGEIDEFGPITQQRWYRWVPHITLRLQCKPFGYGAEVTVGSSTSTSPLIEYTIASVTGDVPAEARLILTDNATQSRRHVEWGLQQRYYDAATSLILDSDSLVTSGFSGTGTTRTGAYDPGAAGNSVVRGTFNTPSLPIAVCGTGNLAHVGTYRVKARVYPVIGTATATDMKIRLTWREGDGPLRSNDYATLPVGTANWNEIDLGLITIPEKTLGTQRWTGQIDASSTTAGDTLDIDYLTLIPTENYGKARSAYSYQAGVTAGYDSFTSTTAGNALNARVAPAGGTWATSGVAGDFLFADAPGSLETLTRTSVADADAPQLGRVAILGATNYTDTEVGVRFYFTAKGNQAHRLVARWTDINNYVTASLSSLSATNAVLNISALVAASGGGSAGTWIPSSSLSVNTWYRLRATTFASGAITVWLMDDNYNVIGQTTTVLSALATGGALATGKPGLSDYDGSSPAVTRYYDDFYVSTPSAEPIVVYSGRAGEVRHDSAIRQDSTGTYYGPFPLYRGSRFLLPCAGSAARTTRLAVKVRRNDVDASADDQIADSTTVQVKYTPRYLAIPR